SGSLERLARQVGRDPGENVARRLQVQDVAGTSPRMPQHAKRLKVRRKDLRKPDEFETLTGQAVDWAQAHRPLVGGVVIAALVAAVIALGVGRWRSSRDEAAAAAFNLAQATFTDGKFADAARAFEDVLTTYPRAP